MAGALIEQTVFVYRFPNANQQYIRLRELDTIGARKLPDDCPAILTLLLETVHDVPHAMLQLYELCCMQAGLCLFTQTFRERFIVSVEWG